MHTMTRPVPPWNVRGASLALRALPAPVLQRLAGRRRLGRVARLGLQQRVVRLRSGAGAGLRFDVGWADPSAAVGSYEGPVQECLLREVRPGAVVYDIGANVGFFTVLAAKAVGPAGHVVAFEPHLDNAALIQRNAAGNDAGNVTVVARAVSASTGVGVLQVADVPVGHSLAGEADPPPGQVGAVPVETVAIDDFVNGAGVRAPDVVKIDVEGAELPVLEGMKHVLETFRPVLVIEVDGPDTPSVVARRAPIEDFLDQRGYRVEKLPAAYPHIAWTVEHLLARPAATASA